MTGKVEQWLPRNVFVSGIRVVVSWPNVRKFVARFHPAGIKPAKPTRESIRYPLTYHDLTKLDLPAMGSNLTRPLIAAAGRQNDRVRLLDRVANGGKRMPNRCPSTAMIKIDSK